ncbi:hypothetical protein J5N97_015010 [Dioscorea zingiberensis]|uniref:Nephrocystin-3 n=1 Tax=Dioscorea zingiberensis TaxID=325984 RepID=A0A9D5CTF9_9LILI|nr:hypothetical protein J5N97_015010 [Dioscorea zingiberensis]
MHVIFSFAVDLSSAVFSLSLSPLASQKEEEAMLRRALRRAATQISASFYPVSNPTILRFCGSSGPGSSQEETVARQMIQYALGHARSQKSGESYAQAMLVMEQGVSNLQERGGKSAEDAMGLLMLAMSTLLYDSGELRDAMEKLQMVQQLGGASLSIRVAALESLIGLKLELGEDDVSQILADDCFELLRNQSDGGAFSVLNSRAKAIKGLADLAIGELKTAESLFCDKDFKLDEDKHQKGNAILSYGVYLHATGNFSLAKDLYERAIKLFEAKDGSDYSYTAATNMIPEEILLGAACALGQLLSQSGKFHDAEEVLTKALNKAESYFGSTHPKVGVLLTCIALMYKHKAKMEASSSILIQEGLYRKAIDLLKAPGLDSEVNDIPFDGRDIATLARGGYAEILSIQQNRRAEGERMRKWAEATWKNRRLSLAQALEFSEPSQMAVIDTRICRVL